jgi:hypothetical protein
MAGRAFSIHQEAEPWSRCGSCEAYHVRSSPQEDAAFKKGRWAKIKAQQKKAA